MQMRLLELVKNYDCIINYHFGQANVVVDALSCKPTVYSVALLTNQVKILADLRRLDIVILGRQKIPNLSNLKIQPTIYKRIEVEQT